MFRKLRHPLRKKTVNSSLRAGLDQSFLTKMLIGDLDINGHLDVVIPKAGRVVHIHISTDENPDQVIEL